MESFKKFLENEELQKTRSDSEHNVPNLSAIKYENVKAAKSILGLYPKLTLRLAKDYDKISDLIGFSERHEFDDSMPLFSLLSVYEKYR